MRQPLLAEFHVDQFIACALHTMCVCISLCSIVYTATSFRLIFTLHARARALNVLSISPAIIVYIMIIALFVCVFCLLVFFPGPYGSHVFHIVYALVFCVILTEHVGAFRSVFRTLCRPALGLPARRPPSSLSHSLACALATFPPYSLHSIGMQCPI